MTEFLTKNAGTAIVEIKEKLYERITELRSIQRDLSDFQGTFWEGVVAQCGNEERFLSELLDLIERS